MLLSLSVFLPATLERTTETFLRTTSFPQNSNQISHFGLFVPILVSARKQIESAEETKLEQEPYLFARPHGDDC